MKSYNRVIPLQSSVILGNLIPQFLRIKIQPAWKGDPTCRRMIVSLIGRKVCAIVDRRGRHKKVKNLKPRSCLKCHQVHHQILVSNLICLLRDICRLGNQKCILNFEQLRKRGLLIKTVLKIDLNLETVGGGIQNFIGLF